MPDKQEDKQEDNTVDPAEEQATNAPASSSYEQVELDTPLQRGNKTVASITLRKPSAGELRGASLTELLQMDVSALTRVLPRISDPVLTEKDIAGMDPADLTQLGGAVAGFLLPKRANYNTPI